jgi:hypothetical protein
VAPDRADLHAAERLPHVLAGADDARTYQLGAFGRDHALGDGRRFLIDPYSGEDENGERRDEHDAEGDPRSAHGLFLA